MPVIRTRELYTMPATGGTKSFAVNTYVDIYKIVATGGAITLSASMNFTASGTPLNGMEYRFLYSGGVTSNTGSGFVVTFMGTALTDAQALLPLEVNAYYNGSAWEVRLFLDLSNTGNKFSTTDLIDQSVTTAKLANQNVTLGKLAASTGPGYLILGGSTGSWGQLNASGNAKILIGDGTTLGSKSVTGPVSINNAGVTSIGNGVITPAMLSFTIGVPLVANLTIPSATVLTMHAPPVTIIPAPGVGLGIEIISITGYIIYNTTAYATHTTLQIYDGSGTLFQDAYLLQSTVSRAIHFQKVYVSDAFSTQISSNSNIYIGVQTGNATAGDSDITISINYRLVNLNPNVAF